MNPFGFAQKYCAGLFVCLFTCDGFVCFIVVIVVVVAVVNVVVVVVVVVVVCLFVLFFIQPKNISKNFRTAIILSIVIDTSPIMQYC